MFPLCLVFLLFIPSLFTLAAWDAHLSAFCFRLISHICKHVAGTASLSFIKMRPYFYRFSCVFFFSCNRIYGNSLQLHGVSLILIEWVYNITWEDYSAIRCFLMVRVHFCLCCLPVSACNKHPNSHSETWCLFLTTSPNWYLLDPETHVFLFWQQFSFIFKRTNNSCFYSDMWGCSLCAWQLWTGSERPGLRQILPTPFLFWVSLAYCRCEHHL